VWGVELHELENLEHEAVPLTSPPAANGSVREDDQVAPGSSPSTSTRLNE
jgi:hypothetical protein